MLKDFNEASETIRLKINIAKTQIIANLANCQVIYLNGVKVEETTTFKYFLTTSYVLKKKGFQPMYSPGPYTFGAEKLKLTRKLINKISVT